MADEILASFLASARKEKSCQCRRGKYVSISYVTFSIRSLKPRDLDV